MRGGLWCGLMMGEECRLAVSCSVLESWDFEEIEVSAG